MDVVGKIAKLRWWPVRQWFYVRQAMELKVRVKDREDETLYRFIAGSIHSYQRAKALISKEPGTIAWIKKNLKSDTVFLDIGANIGTFSIYAAKHLGESGHVFACEPHLPSAVQLVQNIELNELQDKVSVLTVAASGADEFVPFHYKRFRPGASGSQLGVDGGPGLEKPVGTELKYGAKVDSLIAQGVMPPPHMIKIDTDGIELQITSGMKQLLTGNQRPVSLIIEVQVGDHESQKAYMAECGYKISSHNLGRKAQRMMDETGGSYNDVAFTAVFDRLD